MALLHRALVSWFLFLIFLILLVVRLDQRTNWNWFIVFIPLWIFDGVVLTYFLFYLVNRCKNRNRAGGGGSSFSQLFCTEFLKRKIYMLVTVVFKMSTQILLCLRLTNPTWNIPLYTVFIPIWSLLSFALIRVAINLHRRRRNEAAAAAASGSGALNGTGGAGGFNGALGFRSTDSVTAAAANLASIIQERLQRAGGRAGGTIVHIQPPQPSTSQSHHYQHQLQHPATAISSGASLPR